LEEDVPAGVAVGQDLPVRNLLGEPAVRENLAARGDPDPHAGGVAALLQVLDALPDPIAGGRIPAGPVIRGRNEDLRAPPPRLARLAAESDRFVRLLRSVVDPRQHVAMDVDHRSPSPRRGRAISPAIASRGEVPSYRTRRTCSTIGISTPRAAASSQAECAVR